MYWLTFHDLFQILDRLEISQFNLILKNNSYPIIKMKYPNATLFNEKWIKNLRHNQDRMTKYPSIIKIE